MEPNYLASIKEHIQQCVQELDFLSSQIVKRKLTVTEYFAAERVLQVLIESAIGFAKQWVKDFKKIVPSDVYISFITLHDEGIVAENELDNWKKIIELRNILVHDYLNIDRKIIDRILEEKQYQMIVEFISRYKV